MLVVEDSENDALLLVRELKKGGYEPLHERVQTPEAIRRSGSNSTPDTSWSP